MVQYGNMHINKATLEIIQYLPCSMHPFKILSLCVMILMNLDKTVGLGNNEGESTIDGRISPMPVPWENGESHRSNTDFETFVLEAEDTVGTLRHVSEVELESSDEYLQREFSFEEEIIATENEGLMPVQPVQTMTFARFERELRNAKSIHDVLRLFYGQAGSLMNDSDIEQAFTHKYKQTHRRGHRRHNAFNPPSDEPMMSDQPSFEGTRPHSYPSDSNFQDFHIIKASQTFIENHRTPHRKRHKRKGIYRKRADQPVNSQEEISLAYSHFEEMSSGALDCGTPVPECLDIKNLSTTPNEQYLPQCTRVHRCKRESGCCNATSHCGPKSEEDVTKYVFVSRHNPDGSETQLVKKFTFKNHTACECKPINQIKNCLPCPYPFQQSNRVNVTHCTCDCFVEDSICVRIKKGGRKLFRSSRQCIENGECQEPSCTRNRYYDSETGYCNPLSTKSLQRRNAVEQDQRTRQYIAGSGSDEDIIGET